jgi:hypothetical protein
MQEPTRLGLDVHKDTIAVATLRPGQETPEERVIPNTPEARTWDGAKCSVLCSPLE